MANSLTLLITCLVVVWTSAHGATNLRRLSGGTSSTCSCDPLYSTTGVWGMPNATECTTFTNECTSQGGSATCGKYYIAYSSSSTCTKLGGCLDCDSVCQAGTTYSDCTSWSDGTCFHEDTIINYKNKEFNMQDFLAGKETECHVPHTVEDRGLVIKTSCFTGQDMRLTDAHLVGTPIGFVKASSLTTGQQIYGANKESLCEVLSVERETETQTYFGLNCWESEVSASGIHTSTFGLFHHLPATYMKVMGSLFGIKFASSSGVWLHDIAKPAVDYVDSLFY